MPVPSCCKGPLAATCSWMASTSEESCPSWKEEEEEEGMAQKGVQEALRRGLPAGSWTGSRWTLPGAKEEEGRGGGGKRGVQEMAAHRGRRPMQARAAGTREAAAAGVGRHLRRQAPKEEGK